jgi:hypothetical protein
MKVFISWSGSQSNYIAKALRDWLRDVIQNLTPWMSEVDTPAGERWGEGLRKELQDSQFGVVCLTAENLQAPWLHYEAGALAKTVEGPRVCPYLYKIDPSEVQGPLSVFQWKRVDEQGTKELVHSINAASLTLTERGLPLEQLDKTFTHWWPELEKKLAAVPSITVPSPRRETREMVEEILEIVRNQSRPPDRSARIYLTRTLPRRVAQEPPPPSDTPQEGKTPSK